MTFLLSTATCLMLGFLGGYATRAWISYLRHQHYRLEGGLRRHDAPSGHA